jgi:hypothetical protein
MRQGSGTSRIVLGTLLFVLLVGVQTIAFAHAFEHDATALGDRPCATCINLGQLAAVAIDTGGVPGPVFFQPVRVGYYAVTVAVATLQSPNQRGPPAPS